MFGLSLIQLYWAGMTAVASVKLFQLVTSGGQLDKSNGDRDPDGPLGLLQFRKRLPQYYFVGLVAVLWTIWNIFWCCLGSNPGVWYGQDFDYFTGGSAFGKTDPLHVLIALVMLEFHFGRRYYESLSISIFSGRQTFNPLVVVLFFLNQVAVALTAAADLPSLQFDSCFSLSNLSLRPLVALPLFVWATKVHHQTHLNLAKLRKNRAGHVVTSSYKIPKVGMFENVSCPHYFAEIVIFLSIGVLLGSNACTWWLLTAYVSIVNILLGYGTHAWYLSRFSEYPRDRKMVIPYLL